MKALARETATAPVAQAPAKTPRDSAAV
jgi:hypothetical protein